MDNTSTPGAVRPSSPTRERTRNAILLAGISVLVTDPAASMGAVAAHAGVARSTLHRYFPDRSALTREIDEYVEEQYEEAIAMADVYSGTGHEAFERVVEELQDRIGAFSWWMQIVHAEVDDFDSEPDRLLLEVISRGQADGTIDAQFPPTWIHTMLWTTLWTAHKQITLSGQRVQPIRDAVRTTLRKIITPQQITKSVQ